MNQPLFILFFVFITLLGFSACNQPAPVEQKDTETPPNFIRLAPEAVRSIHMTTETVTSQAVSNQLLTIGEIKANENNVFHINSFVSGRILQDNVVLGQAIKPGQVLAVIQNLDVAKIQAEYIHELHQNEIDIAKAKTRYELAKKNAEREKQLVAEGISPRRDYQQAEAEAELAKTELYGQHEHKIHINAENKALLGAYGVSANNAHSEVIKNSSPVISPRTGIITKKTITVGDMVAPDTLLYEVSDLSQLWLDITIYPKDIAQVRIGQTVEFLTDSLPGQLFTGRIDYVQPISNETNPTYIARAYLDNTKRQLKPGMLGKIKIDKGEKIKRVIVPEDAVQKYGREFFVFVPLGNGKFKKRTIRIGHKSENGYLVEDGLSEGETVVTQGSFNLKAELLKSQFAETEE